MIVVFIFLYFQKKYLEGLSQVYIFKFLKLQNRVIVKNIISIEATTGIEGNATKNIVDKSECSISHVLPMYFL